MRIAALWKKTADDGSTKINGTTDVATGINIPAGVKVGVSIVPNTNKTGNQPDFYIEMYELKNNNNNSNTIGF